MSHDVRGDLLTSLGAGLRFTTTRKAGPRVAGVITSPVVLSVRM